MKKILILGATGMLGSAVYDVLKDKYELILAVRDKEKINLLNQKYGGADNHKVVLFDAEPIYQDYVNKKGSPGEYLSNFLKEAGEVDFVINAIGITIPYAMANPALTLFINGALPHILAGIFGEKLIHITTDCVYNGKEGFPYDENSLKTPVDIYGLSKSLGEPDNCLTIRTSIIGRELEGFTGLLEWFLHQKEKEIIGFAEHYWNGITTKEFGKICDKIMENRNQFPKTGIYHIFSNSVSKYEMLLKFKDKFNINCVIKKDRENKVDRTLATVKDLNSGLRIPTFNQMIDGL